MKSTPAYLLLLLLGIALLRQQAPAADLTRDSPRRAEPSALLQFILSPDTPHAARQAAVALRGRDSLPPELLPRILAIRAELAAEQRLHNWGMKLHPLESRPRAGNLHDDPPSQAGEVRTVLGHAWRVPQSWVEYPLTPEQESSAPWPWQVQRAIDGLYGAMAPSTHEPGTAPADEQDRWLAACLTLPLETDDQAWEFVVASGNAGWTRVSWPVAVRVLAHWRAIALNPRMPRGATAVGQEFVQLMRITKDPDLLKLGEVIATDIIRGAQEGPGRQVAMSLKELARTTPGRGIDPGITAILAAAEAAVTSDKTGTVNRLYAFAYSVAEAVEDPALVPLRANGGVQAGSAEAATLSGAFEHWFADHRRDLVRRADAREQLLTPVRQSLEAEEAEQSTESGPRH